MLIRKVSAQNFLESKTLRANQKVPKPVSRSHELGRAIGYNLDPALLLEELKRAPKEQWNHAMLDHVAGSARGNNRPGSKAKRMWLVVKLENNVPAMINAYTDKRSANVRERFLRAHMRSGRDEVRVVQLDVAK